ncbi:MAG: tRNA preQ1(34) S-adenosylmethionine ribosyltransferase-isomerase QueA [Candidatus Makaraimicrobium thalassicum]|nr:MAG: tRNA preQ1(34) S-adenosylmethionine ribosyltransferase-isomerase QueA [Candidatus Omnitrophota bacterium]
MKLSEFDYDLPREIIAQEPLKQRDMSRLMVLDRRTRSITGKIFRDIIEYIGSGDCLVLNDTRVIPVRLYGRRRTGAKVEIFVLNPASGTLRALVRPSKRVKDGEKIELESGIQATVFGAAGSGRFVRFDAPIGRVLESGHMPLPPYISRRDTSRDREDYQTVYARKDGATASPTAGLHFAEGLLERLKKKGAVIVYVTLHTSYGTFAPVTSEDIEEHLMHTEYYEISKETADAVNRTKVSGGRVFAVGTTSTRVLETAAAGQGKVAPSSGETDLFIYPGYRFKVTDSIITNFHLPKSTLLMLVSAFGGRDLIFRAYKQAMESGFRFFSYGDAMLVL